MRGTRRERERQDARPGWRAFQAGPVGRVRVFLSKSVDGWWSVHDGCLHGCPVRKEAIAQHHLDINALARWPMNMTMRLSFTGKGARMTLCLPALRLLWSELEFCSRVVKRFRNPRAHTRTTDAMANRRQQEMRQLTKKLRGCRYQGARGS